MESLDHFNNIVSKKTNAINDDTLQNSCNNTHQDCLSEKFDSNSNEFDSKNNNNNNSQVCI